MRVRIVLFSALVLMGGCRTSRLNNDQTAALKLTTGEQSTAAALAHYALGSLYEQTQGPFAPDTITEFEQASKHDPTRHRIRSKIALGYLMRHESGKAIATLKESCQRNPGQLQPLIDLALTYQLTGKSVQALKTLAKAIDLAPGESALYASAAKIYIQQNNDAAAIKILRRGLRTRADKGLLQLLSARGKELITQKDTKGALQYFLLFRDEGDDVVSPQLLNLIGQLYLETQQPVPAEENFARAAQFPRPPTETFTQLGATQMYLGRRSEAIATFKKGCKLYPQDTRLLFSLALAYNAVNRVEEAYQILQRIRALTEKNPDKKLSAEFYITYGATADYIGRTLEAEEAFRTCIHLYPEADQALNYMAYVWAETDTNLDQAMEYVAQALKIEPENPAYIDTLGWIYYRQGNYTAARDELKKALAIMPDEPIMNEHMGDVYDALDAPEKARHYWTRSVMGDPGNRSALWKLKASGINVKKLVRRARKAQKCARKRD